jgi:hypothetical protein
VYIATFSPVARPAFVRDHVQRHKVLGLDRQTLEVQGGGRRAERSQLIAERPAVDDRGLDASALRHAARGLWPVVRDRHVRPAHPTRALMQLVDHRGTVAQIGIAADGRDRFSDGRPEILAAPLGGVRHPRLGQQPIAGDPDRSPGVSGRAAVALGPLDHDDRQAAQRRRDRRRHPRRAGPHDDDIVVAGRRPSR